MNKLITLLVLCLILTSCGREKSLSYEETADLVCLSSESFWATSIYFDSYERLEDGKYMFYDKDGKYAGEIYPYDGFYIEKNARKK